MDVETRELLLSILDPEDLPSSFHLAELEADIADLWQRSTARLAEGRVEAWAALLVQDATGALRLIRPSSLPPDHHLAHRLNGLPVLGSGRQIHQINPVR